MADPHWTAYASALLTPLVAVIGLLIAYKQWRTARDKLKHELFDRRFSIFEASRDLCESLSINGKLMGSEYEKLSYKAIEAKWLINEEVSKYLESLCEKAIQLDVINYELEQFYEKYPMSRYLSSTLDEVSEDDRKKIFTRHQMKKELINWFNSQHGDLNKKFSPFLTINH